jgi:hypothetical protein
MVTSVPIEGNFFTRICDNKLVICTSHQLQELLAESGRSIEESVTLSACQGLIAQEVQRVTDTPWLDLYHPDPRGCIFDLAGVKEQRIAKMRKCEICNGCRGRLDEANIDQEVVRFVDRVLRRIKQPSFQKAVDHIFSSSILSFIYGGLVVGTAINLFSTVIMANTSPTASQKLVLYAIGLIAIGFPFAVLVWLQAKFLKSRIK